MKDIFKKIKLNSGEETIDTALLLAILLPIFLSFTIGGWAFFEAQSECNDINFEAGRYLSVNGCTSNNAISMHSENEFSNYTIFFNDNQYSATGTKGEIRISCVEPATKGTEILVSTTTNSARFGTYFPIKAARTAYFTQETTHGYEG